MSSGGKYNSAYAALFRHIYYLWRPIPFYADTRFLDLIIWQVTSVVANKILFYEHVRR